MPQGARYTVYGTLNIYNTADDAINRRSPRSTITNTSSSVEGAGQPYIDNFSGYANYLPAVPIWWMPSWGGSGYNIGWVNDNDNINPTPPDPSIWVGDISGVPRRAKAVYVGDSNGVPRKAKSVYVGDTAGIPRKTK